MNRAAQFFPLRDDNPRVRVPFITWALIAINIVVFLISLTDLEGFVSTFGFTPAAFSIITMFTSMFLHGGWEHLLGNMWFLFIFGDNVEDVFGHWLYLLFYVLAGVAATLSHYFLNLGSSVPAVGASGAISGVLGAYLILFPHVGVYVSGGLGHAGKVSAKVMLLFWFGFQLVSAFFSFGGNVGIAFFAHIGGFVFGAVVAWLYVLSRGRPQPAHT
jgi:membrane associated rhomboid family serine protease